MPFSLLSSIVTSLNGLNIARLNTMKHCCGIFFNGVLDSIKASCVK
jgi:hypothetical protein